MNITMILPYYLIWHYGPALQQSWNIWNNFAWFLYNFFSIPLLLRTLFAPWEKIQEAYPKGFHLEEAAGVMLINILMRCVGALVRLTMVLIGSIGLLLLTIVGIVFSVLWLALPFVLLILLIAGIREIL